MLRVGFFIALLALIGAVVSGLVAYRAYEQESLIDRAALSREVDVHASIVQERLSERELLARVSVGAFRPSSVMSASALQPLRPSLYALKTDFVVTGWFARIPSSEFPAASAELKKAGFKRPEIRSFDDGPFDPSEAREPVSVLMDVEPVNDNTTNFPGRVYDQHPVIGPALAQAMKTGAPVSSEPLRLTGQDRPLGVVLVTPVLKENSSTTIGFITTSYRIGNLMLTNDDLSLFSVALQDPRAPNSEISVSPQGEVITGPTRQDGKSSPLVRDVTFGGREWRLDYYAKVDASGRAKSAAFLTALIGLAVTCVICGLFGYVSYNNVRMSREIQARIGFERRLTTVIDELNHRVKNILAVIQSIVTRTLRHGADVDTARELLIGRIHAMSNVITLLSDSQWQGVKLLGLFQSRAIPHSERIAVDGPDIIVSARAAQSLALLFYELASHSDEGLSLVGKHPHVVARWDVQGEEPDAIFHFRWEEFNTSEATRKPETDFGIVLLDRVAPEALGGTSKRYFTDASYVYELSAPMLTVVDENEMNRTGNISGSAPRRG